MTIPLVTNVLLADDHPLVPRRACARCSTREPDLRVVAEAADGAEAVELALAPGSDVHLAMLDVSMPRMTGLQAAREITRRDPEIRVLMLSMHDNEQLLLRGARGRRVRLRAQDRGRPRPRRGRAGRRCAASRSSTRARCARSCATTSSARAAARRSPRTTRSPPREQEIVKLIAEAHTNDEIAELLTISKKTVERHRANILEKLGMRDRVELTRYAIRRGLVEP